MTLLCRLIVAAGGLLSLPLWAEGEAPLPPGDDMLAATVRVTGFLLIFIVLAVLGSRLAKRIHPALGGGPIEIVGGRSLAPGVGISIVRVGSRHLLIGFTKEHIALLTELESKELPGPREITS